MKMPTFYQLSCCKCPELVKAKSPDENNYCTGFPDNRKKRFPKGQTKRKIPNWCPKHISPPICRIYGFINEEEATKEFELNHDLALELETVFPSLNRYVLRCCFPLGMTAKELCEALQQRTISSIFPDIEFRFGEIIEINDGLKPYCFYYTAEKGFIQTIAFNPAKIGKAKALQALSSKEGNPMILHLTATTPVSDLIIDYIEVQLRTGEIVSLNWDESEILRTKTGFDARYKGVCFGEEYANGRLDDLQEMQVKETGLYSESEHTGGITIEEMLFEDGERNLMFEAPIYAQEGCDLSG